MRSLTCRLPAAARRVRDQQVRAAGIRDSLDQIEAELNAAGFSQALELGMRLPPRAQLRAILAAI